MKPLLLLSALCCAILAGCVREESPEMRTVVPRSDAAIEPVSRSEAATSTQRLLPPPEALTDAVITGKIKAEILADPALRGIDISVNTTQGVVNLTGLVATQEQTAVASAHAQRQDGVMRVDNHLAVDIR